jgi:hypothetical protein
MAQACLEDLEYAPRRELDRALMRQLATGRWIAEHRNVLITGATGVGKTYLACALGQHACRQGYRAIYRRLPRFFQELALARADGSYPTVLARLARIDVLILDDWGLAAVTDVQRQDLLEVMEDRDATRSTIITSQLPRDQWHTYLGDPTIADAVLDRRGRCRPMDAHTRPQSLENRADAVSHTAHRHHRLEGGRKQNEDNRPVPCTTITGGEHRLTYPAAQRRFAPITMPWSP